MLPAHLDRALHATCGRISEDVEDGATVATIADIEARMGDPPSRPVLQGWLRDLEERGLVQKAGSGWRVTAEGWRGVNMLSPIDDDGDEKR